MNAELLIEDHGITAPESYAEASLAHTLLMCPPKLYDVNYVINPWMRGNVGTPNRDRAMRQWQRLRDVLCRLARVMLIEPMAGSPDMVFTANAGLARDGVVALSSFFYRERQDEEPAFRRWFEKAGYSVIDVARATPFEGEGDALFSADGTRLWVGFGTRGRRCWKAMMRCADCGMRRCVVCGWWMSVSITSIPALRRCRMGR